MIINKKTNEIEVNREIPYGEPNGTHGQNRRFRLTAQNTYLMPYLSQGKVVEYDRNFNELWSYNADKPWAAIHLKNGNILISDEGSELVREVRPDNGNTILCARGEGGRTPQLVEITPDKQVAWVVKDWKNLGPATAVQILRNGGVPENPGECQR